MNSTGELQVGSRIGQIEVTGILGEGGMGRVYSAFDQRLERKVALKLLRGEHRLADDARARFLREARMLSRIKDPRICRIYDVLERQEGDILILELVEGRTLREVMKEGLGRSEALSYALQLLEVLSAVHREGVIHRDLKLENIMLQADGTIKVLDFGLARATAEVPEVLASAPEDLRRQQKEEETAEWISPARQNLTRRGVVVGTLRYMSPEQARGEPVGPPSDVYSAALNIQEMLTGRPVFDPDLSMASLLKKVGWGDRVVPAELSQPLRDLLGRMTALAPAERPSAVDAVDQLRRIVEQPKRRRRRVVFLGVFVAMTLLASGMSVQWFRATREAEKARRSLKETKEVSAFLESLLQASNPFFVRDPAPDASMPEVKVGTLVNRGTEIIRGRFAEQPLARARFLLLLGRIQQNLGHLGEADELISGALKLRRRYLAVDDPAVAEALANLGELRRRQANFDEAGKLLNEALNVQLSAGQADAGMLADTYSSLGLLASARAEWKEAISLLEKALEIQRASHAGKSTAVALSLQRIADSEAELLRYDAAQKHYEQALKIVQENLGAGRVGSVSILNQMGKLERSRGNVATAENYFRRALNICRSTLPPEHPERGTLLTNLANLLDDSGRYVDAEPLYREALEIKEKSLGPTHPETAQVVLNLAILEQHIGHYEESETFYRRALAALEQISGPKLPSTGLAQLNFGVLQLERRRYSEAEKLYRSALTIFKASVGSRHPLCAITMSNLGEVLRLEGKLQASEASFRKALAVAEEVFPEDSPEMKEIKRTMAETLVLLGKVDEAKQLRLASQTEQ